MAHSPASVAFTERSTAATVSLEPLTARKNSNNFWLFLSGIKNGDVFAKNSDNFQLLNGTLAFGAAQRLGRRDTVDRFVLILGDNA